ncbi:oligoendopeptidase F [Butyrivibrio sp. XPD2002]|uniref:oligoendopeptidase F n=1 Tax=Butyrivibrio sp. XPD2002 TaxID=1280665 RepID=UPI000422FE32|nr:oligoendopeptidase F [Butyrivibrio sp. XPD2002]
MQGKLPKRNEVEEALTWRLEDIYENEELWESEVKEALSLADKIAEFNGKVADSAKNLLEVLKLFEKASLLISRFHAYAHMRHDQDSADSKYTGMNQRATSAYLQIGEKASFLEPEVLSISDDTLTSFYADEPELKNYELKIKEIRRLKDHILSKELEQLLASAGEMSQTPYNGFNMLSDADLKFPSVTDSEGKEVVLSNGRFVPVQMSKDRELRKKAFEVFYGRYEEFKNTWAALYDGEVKARIFNAKARKYNSNFEAAVNENDVDPAVCDRLIDSIHKGFDKMHRYVALRKKLLGVDELHMYDVYVSMISDFDMEVGYEEAKDISLKALAPLGDEYLGIVKKAYDDRWIDVVENEGKRSGAYSSGAYGVHPYMLLNYNNTLEDVFTLVHEMGHSMHTWYSEHEQSIWNSEYKIFVAEVASTTNEVLLYHYLKDHAKSKEEKAYIINHFLESFKSTMYRQTMFEEFERKTNEMAEKGEPLTAESLSDVYYNLNKEYFGENMVSDPQIAYEWCRIPHFYYNFYVYQYATSFAASVSIAKKILEEGAPAVEQYKKFLKSGCTQDPVSLLKIAGVDLTTAAPIEDALKVFEEALVEMEELYK